MSILPARIELISPSAKSCEIRQSVVQFNDTCLSLFDDVLKSALFSAALSVLNNALTNEVRIEESWLVFSLRYNRTAYFFSA